MTDSRKDLIVKIEAQRATIRIHVEKYNKFKKNGDYTSSAEVTIENAQRTIRALKAKDKSIQSSWEDSCGFNGS